MSISIFSEATGNELEIVRKRLGEAEGAVETAQQEWKAAKRRRREAKEAARRAKKQLRRAKEELELAQCAVTEAEKVYARHVAMAARTNTKVGAIKRAKKKTKKSSEMNPVAATALIGDFQAQTSAASEPGPVETIAQPSTASCKS